MAQSLSAATSSEIEHVTRLCQRLEFFVAQPPLHVRALSHGESNQSYYVKTAQGNYVLRCYPSDSVICRQQELRCQHAAAALGLAPAPLLLNNHYQVMLSEYIDGGVPFVYQQHGSACLLSSLARFHQLPAQATVLDPSAYITQLVSRVTQPGAVPLIAALHRAAQKLQQLAPDTVLCHLDLHAGNLLYAAEKLWLLDFEYSQCADSSLDLAAISLHFELNSAEISQMLTDYACYRAAPELADVLAEKLPAARQLYSGFCWLWYLSQPAATPQAELWRQRLVQLTETAL